MALAKVFTVLGRAAPLFARIPITTETRSVEAFEIAALTNGRPVTHFTRPTDTFLAYHARQESNPVSLDTI